jgi:hypothetical protein
MPHLSSLCTAMPTARPTLAWGAPWQLGDGAQHPSRPRVRCPMRINHRGTTSLGVFRHVRRHLAPLELAPHAPRPRGLAVGL